MDHMPRAGRWVRAPPRQHSRPTHARCCPPPWPAFAAAHQQWAVQEHLPGPTAAVADVVGRASTTAPPQRHPHAHKGLLAARGHATQRARGTDHVTHRWNVQPLCSLHSYLHPPHPPTSSGRRVRVEGKRAAAAGQVVQSKGAKTLVPSPAIFGSHLPQALLRAWHPSMQPSSLKACKLICTFCSAAHQLAVARCPPQHGQGQCTSSSSRRRVFTYVRTVHR